MFHFSETRKKRIAMNVANYFRYTLVVSFLSSVGGIFLKNDWFDYISTISILLVGIDSMVIGIWAVVTGYIRMSTMLPHWTKEVKSLISRFAGLFFFVLGLAITIFYIFAIVSLFK
ncbi:MAG: hypothetical protein AAB778_03290 [Patescibacteria group bacterium]